jgi:DNA polymerase III delta prime subunit
MLSRIVVSQNPDSQIKAAERFLDDLKIKKSAPDLLWLESEGSIGIKDIKQVKEHLSFKPLSLKGKVVIIIGADNLTPDAQNSLLKTLEEPPTEAKILLTTSSEHKLLPTILSRCELIYVDNSSTVGSTKDKGRVESLISSDKTTRFEIIEKTEDKEELLNELVGYFSEKLSQNPEGVEFAKLLIEAEKWQKAQGNTRVILEYLMLNLN